MSLGSFSSLLEFAAAMNMALIAMEYINVYSNKILSKLFSFEKFVDAAFRRCNEHLAGEGSLEEMLRSEDPKIDKDAVQAAITKDIELRNNNAEQQKQSLDKIIQKCQSVNFAAVSLWLTLYCVTGLYFVGTQDIVVNKVQFPPIFNLQQVWIFLTSFTVLFTIIGLLTDVERNETTSKLWQRCLKWVRIKLFDLSRLQHSVIWFLVALGLSIGLSYCDGLVISDYWWVAILKVSMFIPFCHFVMLLIIVWNKFRVLKTEVKRDTEVSIDHCRDHKNNCDALTNTYQKVKDYQGLPLAATTKR